MNKFVIMGVQGCGKGTQAKMLQTDFDLVHISVGDIFRWNIQSHTKLAAKVNRIVAEGKLVPDEIVEEIVQKRLQDHDWNYGFILDGFPRNKPQAEFFLESYDIDAVIHIDVPDEVVLQRVISRRLCSQCGLDYNLIHHRPAVENTCDVCGGELLTRPDDNEEAIRRRLNDYHEKTEPVMEVFRRKELIISVDGTQEPDKVQADIRDRLGLKNDHPAHRTEIVRRNNHAKANATT
jgi:adenylate kinase